MLSTYHLVAGVVVADAAAAAAAAVSPAAASGSCIVRHTLCMLSAWY